MKILVTGTAGFIGYSLSLRLMAQGHEVIGVDSVNDYYAVYLKKKRHDTLKENPLFTPAEIDLCDFDPLEKLFKEHKPEMVCNLAAQAGVRYSLTNPFAYQKANLEGFMNILELCKLNGVKRLVYASSSSVYGGVKELPFSEDMRVDTPISLYAATKKANVLMAHTYSHLFGLQTVGLRFFTVYGPWGRPDMALWLFTEAIMEGKPINVFNGGNMQRDFTYIDDIITGVSGALFVDKLPAYSIFNLGNHRCENLMDMISILEESLGKEAKKNFMDMQPGDVQATYANIDKAQELLGYQPTTSIDVGIPNFVEWYMAHPDIAEAVIASREADG